MTHRRALLASAALAAVGLVLAGVLAFEHAQAHAGVSTFCAIDDFVNCDKVATSRYSVVLGLPVAVWGGFAYGLALLLSVAGLRARRPHATWPAGLLFLLGAAATATAVALALVSELVIGALCLLCAGSWLVSGALLAAGWRATRPGGVAAAVREDLALLRRRLPRTIAVAVAGAACVALVAAAYPRYWERPRPPRDAERTQGATGPARPAAARTGGPTIVVEFSDYQCPFCAIAHEETNAILAGRPDVKLVRKNFPLDQACNPVVKRAMHAGACELAAAAVCAEEQGKLEPMSDALFHNQRQKLPLESIAQGVGLDLPAFRECLRLPATARRVEQDISAGIAVGVKATPTYVVNGVAYSGKLPIEALPPATARAP
ncbi:MAG TPA: vitamin K epoxide reductase family protein [Anaeromyxobacter sp.]|nr:vitamin K epoxide reductase family protein [Anaeromyxobacter sp.]